VGQAALQSRVTQILHRLQLGHPSAAEELLPLVYEELRSLADNFFRSERRDHTLQPTALVHEAYLRLVNDSAIQWQGQAHFMAVAANAMRRVLINYAEHHRAAKRGGGMQHVTFQEDDAPGSSAFDEVDLLALDEAMTRLEALDQRQCRVVELRFFGGLSVQQSAEVLGISERTVKLDWKMARAWLYTQLKG
jgi:RNA polymerase sigma factor (TIGR02999 family)